MVWGLLIPLPAASPHKDCGEPGQNHGLTYGSSDLPETPNTQTSLCALEPQWRRHLAPDLQAGTC